MSLQTLRLKRHHTSPNQRRQIITENILLTNYEGLAKLCGVSKRTIIRDIKQWRREGGFEELLINEFLDIYPKLKNRFPKTTFDRLCYLLSKTIVQKAEIKEEYKEIKIGWEYKEEHKENETNL